MWFVQFFVDFTTYYNINQLFCIKTQKEKKKQLRVDKQKKREKEKEKEFLIDLYVLFWYYVFIMKYEIYGEVEIN